MYAALRIRKGDVLSFGGARTGTRGYIAFAGGLDVPVVMGSRSTHLRSRVGGFHGRKLAAGDLVELRAGRARLPFLRARRLPSPDYEKDDGVLRVVPGPQDGLFTREGLETFLRSEYTVTAESDRMGCRLDGPAVAAAGGTDILSDGTVFGAVQVPPSGKPIVLLADRQTAGGYAKIAAVITADLPRLVQKRPDQKIRFRAVTVEQAQELLLREGRELDRLRRRLRHPLRAFFGSGSSCRGKG